MRVGRIGYKFLLVDTRKTRSPPLAVSLVSETSLRYSILHESRAGGFLYPYTIVALLLFYAGRENRTPAD